MDDQGVEDAAILLMSLGEEEASEVFKHLTPKEVQRLGETIARLKTVPRERVTEVLGRFEADAADHNMLVSDTDEYVKSVLRKALGDDKANLIIDRILQGSDISGIESLKWMDASSVAELLRNEHPQIIAAILVHLDFDQASSVVKEFTDRQRNEVMVRIATLDGIQPSALEGPQRGAQQGAGRQRQACARPRWAAPRRPPRSSTCWAGTSRLRCIDFIREADGDLAQKIQDNMFTFDDLLKIDDKGIQALMKEVQSESLIIALKGAHARPPREGLQEHVRAAPPKRCAKTSSRAARCASPRSRPSRRKCSRS